MIDIRRIRARNAKPIEQGAVVYWMQRDQRVQDNWALVYAQEEALKTGKVLYVVFNLVPTFGTTTLRHYDFMFKGLKEVEQELATLLIPFILLHGEPDVTIPSFVTEHGIGHVITDFNPLHFTDLWREKVANCLDIRLSEVDAHNVVPCWIASPKEEFAAYTFRPKIHKHLGEFLTQFPKVQKQTCSQIGALNSIDWAKVQASIKTDTSAVPISWIVGGGKAGHKNLKDFCDQRLEQYATKRNDPNENFLSHLSPYLHFGQVSAQRIALTIKNADVPKDSKDTYLEELIVRRELADNYCFYNANYDRVAGAHAWAQKSITEHVSDARDYIYTKEEFEGAVTHDDLWNAAQLQMVKEGKMHGFMRMYWAKKILEWTPDVQTAIDTALYLNDTYELDGTDPNGVVGVMWSICGVHDRAWTNRPVFGKIRYMNYNGCKRKFDVKAYVEKYSNVVARSLF